MKYEKPSAKLLLLQSDDILALSSCKVSGGEDADIGELME